MGDANGGCVVGNLKLRAAASGETVATLAQNGAGCRMGEIRAVRGVQSRKIVHSLTQTGYSRSRLMRCRWKSEDDEAVAVVAEGVDEVVGELGFGALVLWVWQLVTPT